MGLPEIISSLINDYLILFIFVYFLPTIISSVLRHPHERPLAIINLFLGWTFVVWALCLAWATYKPKKFICVQIKNENE